MVASAFGPPVDAPMTSTSVRDPVPPAAAPDSFDGPIAALGPGAGQSALIFGISSVCTQRIASIMLVAVTFVA